MNSPPLDHRSRAAVALTVVLFGVAWFWMMGGFNVLDPFKIGWMLKGDWHGNLLCSLFVRNGPWGLPLGQAPDLMHPFGSSAAFADCNPVMSTTAKLFSPLLPLQFQPFGLWMLGCVIAMGLVGTWILERWVKDPVTLAIAGMLFVANPVVAARYGHPQFFTQFPLAALVGLGVMPIGTLQEARRAGAAALAFGAFACGVHGYFAAMAMVLSLAVMIRLALTKTGMRRGEQLAWVVAGPVTCLASFGLFGYLVGIGKPLAQLTAEGFGQFSADLGTFWNPVHKTWGRIMPAFPINGRQGEGYAYLGLGILVLLVLRIVLTVRDRKALPSRARWLELLPITIACVAMFVYATSSIVTFHGLRVLDLTSLYAHLGSVASVFRGSGRFAWSLHHLLTLVAVTTIVAFQARPWVMRGLVAGALLLQVGDLDLGKDRFHGLDNDFKPLSSPAWAQAHQGYEHLVIHPVMAQWACPYDERLVSLLSFEAYRNHLSINSGLVGRNPPEVVAACMKHLEPSQLDPKSIYVLYRPDYLQDFVGRGFTCGAIDNLGVCVASDQDTPMLRAVQQAPIGR